MDKRLPLRLFQQTFSVEKYLMSSAPLVLHQKIPMIQLVLQLIAVRLQKKTNSVLYGRFAKLRAIARNERIRRSGLIDQCAPPRPSFR